METVQLSIEKPNLSKEEAEVIIQRMNDHFAKLDEAIKWNRVKTVGRAFNIAGQELKSVLAKHGIKLIVNRAGVFRLNEDQFFRVDDDEED